MGSRGEAADPLREQVSGYLSAGSRKKATLEPEDEVMGSNKMPNTAGGREKGGEVALITRGRCR